MERSWSLAPREVSESLRDQGRQWLKDHGVAIPQDSSKHGVEQVWAYQEKQAVCAAGIGAEGLGLPKFFGAQKILIWVPDTK